MNIFNVIKNFFSADLAIDLGSDNTIIYVKNEGIKLKEPTMAAFKHKYGEREFIQFGSEAKKLLGRTPQNIEVIKPIKNGAIVDLTATEVMIEYFIGQVHEEMFFRPSPNILVAIPSSSSEVERRAIEDAIYNAGAKDVIFVKQGLAAALGAGIDVSSEVPSCVVDIGSDTTEISAIASSGIIYSKTFYVGGNHIASSIEDKILNDYQVLIGSENADKLKKQLATVIPSDVDPEKTMMVKGKNALNNKPTTFNVNQKDIYLGLFDPMLKIIESLDEIFRNLPPETVSSLYQNGILLVGGSSQIKGLPELISLHIGLKTKVPDNPDETVIIGCGNILDENTGFLDF